MKKRDRDNLKAKTMRLNVNPATLPEIECSCGNKTFINGKKIRKLSAIQSLNGQEGYINQPVAVCIKCFEPLPEKP